MAEGDEEPEMVKVELELPKEQVSVEPEEPKKKTDKSKGNETVVEELTGYEAGELIKAPVNPPELTKSPKPARGQVRNMVTGFMLIVLSLVAWPIFGFGVAITIALVGAAFIAVGVLVRV